jgi:hypothetical protein
MALPDPLAPPLPYGKPAYFAAKCHGTDESCLSAVYNAIMQRLPKKYSPPPQTDWMVMCSIRDSKNYILDFEGDFTETAAMKTALKELVGWFNDIGWYQTPEYEESPTLEKLKALRPNANSFLMLSIVTKLLEPTSPGRRDSRPDTSLCCRARSRSTRPTAR